MYKFETDDDRSYFICRLFVHEAFLKEDERNESRKKTGYIKSVSEESYNDTDGAYERAKIDKKECHRKFQR